MRKDAYGMNGGVVDGNDVVAVYEAAQKAVKRARSGEGPTLLECKTYRWRGHYEGEADRTHRYRTADELEDWKLNCPIERYRKRLLEEGSFEEDAFDRIDMEVQEEIQEAIRFAESKEAIRFAENSPFPEPEDALKGLYAS
jgi:pyruvate dehydrogenase E1 component alpha subunit